MLTLFVLPGAKAEKENYDRAVESFGDQVNKVFVLSGIPFNNLKVDTRWFAFIYSDEVLSEGSKESLETFLYVDQWDYYSFYRKSIEGKVSTSPRIYKNGVELMEDAPYPVDIGPLRGTFILDGWVLEQD